MSGHLEEFAEFFEYATNIGEILRPRLLMLSDRARLIAEVVEPVRETSRDLSRSLGSRATDGDGAASGHG